MTDQDTTRRDAPRGAARAPALDDALGTGVEASVMAEKGAAPAPSAPLLDPWLAFVSAGMAASAAGYVFMTASTFLDMFASFGVELPWITSVVVEHPTGVPAALLAASGAVLLLGGLRRSPSKHLDVRAGTRLLAALVGAAACGCIAANALVFLTIQKALQD